MHKLTLSVLANVAFALAALQTPLLLSDAPVSFMDSIFGELVNADASAANKISLEALDSKQYYSHSKLHLPHDDDTTDILDEQSMFGGIVTYAHFPHFNCFDPQLSNNKVDIAIVGAPFDTGVSFRPGARFGPAAIRNAAMRMGDPSQSELNTVKQTSGRTNPYNFKSHNYSIVDCGDVSLSPFDNRVALNQLYRGERAVHKHKGNVYDAPRIITLGGDHTITLMALKSTYERTGKPLRVVHFDSHVDTWDPKKLGGGISDYMSLNHGTFLHYAHEQGYIGDNNWHVGIRAPYIDDEYDPQHDAECGFQIINASEIDTIGVKGIVSRLRRSLGSDPVYITVDIDVLDPAYAPGTGTMEVGGFTGRELLAVLDGLRGIELVGADVVEVSPPYDTAAGITSLAATAVIDSFLKLMV